MSLKHFSILDEDDDDPMLSSINLVDVFLVLVVALMAAVNITTQSAAGEIVVRENGQEIRYRGTGDSGEGEGVRAGVAYRLRDGSIVYVPEGETPKQPE
ncbi:DUF2149 domain-containing protein [Azonexus fungiphilus]|jgi:hypothetical protein|uniref:DUF2149 domain-containing protein n=1 Tax=Azonexus fungiphilus TaxID=146940 RepID=UPI00156BBF69|nr:DUF2149 domain-containing protein [Azonexus fungiphilus]NHC05327.1 DUF2149 domain-containing protein [Azonexus fungiphilus]